MLILEIYHLSAYVKQIVCNGPSDNKNNEKLKTKT